MKQVWKWALGVVLVALVGMITVSVLVTGGRQYASTMVGFDTAKLPTLSVQPVLGALTIPPSGRKKPSSLVITSDGGTWRAFSNWTAPYGCAVVPRDGNRLMEVCHGAVWDLTGHHVAGPGRGLFSYPVTLGSDGWIEIDLAKPKLEWPGVVSH